MKIINPLHLIQFVVVYLYTWYAIRSAPRVEGFNVGWSSPHDDFQVYYNAQVNVLGVITPAQDTTWQPVGWRAWFNLVRAYDDLLEQTTAAFIEAYLPDFADDINESDTEGK